MIFKAPYTEIPQGFPGELSHQYGNENFKFILFSQWEKISLVALRFYEVYEDLLAKSQTRMIFYIY